MDHHELLQEPDHSRPHLPPPPWRVLVAKRDQVVRTSRTGNPATSSVYGATNRRCGLAVSILELLHDAFPTLKGAIALIRRTCPNHCRRWSSLTAFLGRTSVFSGVAWSVYWKLATVARRSAKFNFIIWVRPVGGDHHRWGHRDGHSA